MGVEFSKTPLADSIPQALRMRTSAELRERLLELCAKRHESPALAALRRVVAISDIHVGDPANTDWLRTLKPQRDALCILAGDVSDSLQQLAAALRLLQSTFGAVAFCPGNHDLWVTSPLAEDAKLRSSPAKLLAVLELCDALGVCHGPARIDGCWVVPLLSWYVRGDNGAAGGSIFHEKEGEDPELTAEAWSDHVYCAWPEARTADAEAWGIDGDEVSEWMARLNGPRLEPEAYVPYDGADVVSFSHFLGRVELLFEDSEERARRRTATQDAGGMTPTDRSGKADPNQWFNFARVAGSTAIERQIRAIGSVVHVHGHQHRQRDRVIDGVRYVSHCLANRREREMGLCVVGDAPKEVWRREERGPATEEEAKVGARSVGASDQGEAARALLAARAAGY